ETKDKESKSASDAEIELTGSMVKSSKKKHIKKYAYSAKGCETIFMTEEQINEQKKIKQSLKDDMDKKEVEMGKEELVNHLGINVVTNVYKAKMKYDKEDITDETISNIKASDLHLSEWSEIEFREPLGEQDPIIKLNDLAIKKRKHDDDILKYLRSTKNYKSLVLYEDHPGGTC
nr:hypothetical protein [Tanacetum cinerariifolium]